MTIPWIIAGPRVAHRGPLTRAGPDRGHGAHGAQPAGPPAPADATGKLVSEAFEAQ